MQARVEAVFFGVIAFLVAAQILAGFSSLAYPESAVIDAGRQLQVRGEATCSGPAGAHAQTALIQHPCGRAGASLS